MLQLGFSKYLLLSGEGPRWHPELGVCEENTRAPCSERSILCPACIGANILVVISQNENSKRCPGLFWITSYNDM